jgi:hypothetical protein
MSPSSIILARLAELLVDRLGPALPEGVVASLATEEDLDRVRSLHARLRDAWGPDDSPYPEYGRADGVLCVSVPPSPSRRIVPLTVEHERLFTDDALSDAVIQALNAVADEASETSTDHHECDAAVEDGELRIWFGVVPPKTPSGPWRAVVAELTPIPLDEITADGSRSTSA